MKKILAMLLCLVLALGAAGAASALDFTLELYSQDGNTVPAENADPADSFYPESMAVAGGTVWLTGSANSAEGEYLYRWQEGMEKPQTVGRILFANRFNSLEDLENYWEPETLAGLDTDHLFGPLVSDGDRVITYNPLTGLVFAVGAGENGIVYEDLCTMSDVKFFVHTEDDWSYTITPQSTAAAGGHLLLCINDYGMEGERCFLVDTDLATGETKEVKADFVRQVTSFRDGKALLAIQDYENAWDEETGVMRPAPLSTYDPVTGEIAEAGQVDSGAVSNLVYVPELDVIVYVLNNRVMASSDLTNYTQYGFAPASWSRERGALGSSLVLLADNQVLIRTLTANYSADDYLVAYNTWNDDGMRLFFSRYPQTPLYSTDQYYSNMEQLSQAMVGGENSLDVLRMNLSYENFTDLMNKGYCADLSGDQRIADFVNSLHPVFRDAVTKDGKIYALPVNCWSYDGWYASKEVMKEMGLTEADLPTNLVDLCAFANRWNNEWVEEYPQYTLIEYTEDYKQSLFRFLLDSYLDQCVADGKEVNLTDPVFREVAEAIDHLQVDALTKGAQTANEDEVGYREALFLRDYSVVGDFEFASYNEWRVFVPMTLTKDTPYRTGGQMDVMFINPRTAHMESALNLLACTAEAMDDRTRHVMVTTATDPLENKDYDQLIANEESYLKNLREELEKADPGEKKDYEEMIRAEEEYFEQMKENSRYDISPEAIAYYQEKILPAVYVRLYNRFTSDESGSSELTQLTERYLGGQMTLDQFIRDANGKLMMMQMENY